MRKVYRVTVTLDSVIEADDEGHAKRKMKEFYSVSDKALEVGVEVKAVEI